MKENEVLNMDELEKQIQDVMKNTPVNFSDMDLYMICAYHQIDLMDKNLKYLADGGDGIVSIVLPDITKEGSYSKDQFGKILGVEFRAMKDSMYGVVVDFRVGILKIDSANRIFLASIGCSNWQPTDPNEILEVHNLCRKLISQVVNDESQKIRLNMILMQNKRLIEHFGIAL